MTRLDYYKNLTDEALTACFQEEVPHQKLYEAMRYSLLAGGKRIRPALVLEFSRICGGEEQKTLPAACAVEMLHTYSLIHDDLPCMDNDELRRGKPTNHVVFGETTATLAGDALQAEAFRTLLMLDLDAETRAACALELARAAGADGICAGQLLDIRAEQETPGYQELLSIHALKTASLMIAAAHIGVLCGSGSERQLDAATEYAWNLGLAFQIRDDVLDATSDTETLGKPVGSDAAQEKATFFTLFGAEECERLIADYSEKAKAAVKPCFDDFSFLCTLADELAQRKK